MTVNPWDFSGMNNLGNAMVNLGNDRRAMQQNALLEGIRQQKAVQDAAIFQQQQQQFAQQQQAAKMQQNALLQKQAQEQQQRQAENALFQNMPFLQGQPEIYGEQSGVLMQDIAKQYPNADLGSIYSGVQGMQPAAPKADTFSDAGYGRQRNNRTGEIISVPTAPRAQTTNVFGGGKPPSGYRFTANGELEAIPGGPAAQKQQVNAQTLADGAAAIDYTSSAIDELLNHPGREAATGLSSLNPLNKLPGTDAYNFNAKLESFDAKLFLSNIQQMKGMGALSNAEGAKVSAAAGAIKPGMSEDEFVRSLGIIKTELAKAKARKETGQFLPTTSETTDKRAANIQKLTDADILKALGS